MSENKKDPLQEILTSIDSRLKALENPKKEPSPSTEKPISFKPHTHSANVEFDCPDCQKEYDSKVSSAAIADYKKKLKDGALVICQDCGEIVDKEENECPTCHGKSARRLRDHY
jgi:Fe2+ or Zn2+ uptake regulation protein